MKKAFKLLRLIIFIVFIVNAFLFAGISHGQEEENTVTGQIIEIVPDENIIQVGNRNYIVKMVFLDYGTDGMPLSGRFGNMEIGSLVKIYFGEKK